MKTSIKGINLIKSFEGLHDGDLSQIGLQPKMCPAGIWTEGYGHAMRDKKCNFIKGQINQRLAYENTRVNNESQALKLLKQDLTIYENIVAKKVLVPLNQNQFDALVSFTFNTGGSDGLFKLINSNAPKEAIQKWFETKYITANGNVLKGLVNRRKAESNLYFS